MDHATYRDEWHYTLARRSPDYWVIQTEPL